MQIVIGELEQFLGRESVGDGDLGGGKNPAAASEEEQLFGDGRPWWRRHGLGWAASSSDDRQIW